MTSSCGWLNSPRHLRLPAADPTPATSAKAVTHAHSACTALAWANLRCQCKAGAMKWNEMGTGQRKQKTAAGAHSGGNAEAEVTFGYRHAPPSSPHVQRAVCRHAAAKRHSPKEGVHPPHRCTQYHAEPADSGTTPIHNPSAPPSAEDEALGSRSAVHRAMKRGAKSGSQAQPWRARPGGGRREGSKCAGWYLRVFALVWVFRRKVLTLHVSNHWRRVFLVGESGTVIPLLRLGWKAGGVGFRSADGPASAGHTEGDAICAPAPERLMQIVPVHSGWPRAESGSPQTPCVALLAAPVECNLRTLGYEPGTAGVGRMCSNVSARRSLPGKRGGVAVQGSVRQPVEEILCRDSGQGVGLRDTLTTWAL